MKFSSKIVYIFFIIILYSCSDSADDLRNTPLTESELYARSMAGIWQRNKCSIDGDTDYYRQRYLYIFRTDGTMEQQSTLYSPDDTTCTGDPIARTRETGTFSVGKKVITTNANPLEAYELDLVFDNVVHEGDKFLGDSTLNPYTVLTNAYSLVRVNQEANNMLLADYFGYIETDRLTLLDDDFNLLDSLPANYNNFQTVPTYHAPSVSDLSGDWIGRCSSSQIRLSYQFTPPITGNQGTVNYTVSLFAANDTSCTGQAIASIIYSGTYTVQVNTFTFTYPDTIDAALVDFNLTSKTGDTANTSLPNWSLPRIKLDYMIVDLTRGTLLESSGSGDGTVGDPRPENLGSIYRRP